MLLKSILKNISYTAYGELDGVTVKNVSINSKNIREDSLFISLSGDRDAECEAIAGGARAIMSFGGERGYSVPFIDTDNIRKAYSIACYNLSDIHRDSMRFVGVTGTNGKTSIARIIYTILNKNGIKCGFIGTGKIEIPSETLTSDFYSSTTPDPHIIYPAIKKMEEAGCKYIVMEVSSHSLHYAKLTPLRFCVSIFSNLSPEHMDFHETMNDYYSAKKKIAESSDLLIINKDDKYGRKLCEDAKCKHVSVGILWDDADVKIKNVDINGFDGISYTYYGEDFCFIARSKLCSAVNVYNTALAITALIKIGFKPKDIKRTLAAELDVIEGRFEIICDKPTVILDYAHTPDGLENFLRSVKSFSGNRKIALIFGCGGERDKTKRPKMANIAQNYADSIIVSSDNPRGEAEESIISDILTGFSIFTNYTVIENRAEAIKFAIENADDDDVIAIVGKGAEKYYIDKNGYHPYSDKECAMRAISERNSQKGLKP